MAKKKKSVGVNLLAQEAFEKSFFGKISHWLLTVGRYIVIFTELVVIVCFLFRFKLDRDLNELNVQLQKQVGIIDSYQETEKRFKDLQARVGFLEKIEAEEVGVTALLGKIEAISPRDLTVEKITIDSTSFSINGRVLSPLGFSTFISKLQQEPGFTKLKLDKVSAGGEEVGVNFALTIDLSKQQIEKTSKKKAFSF